jgi:hypothetical protein
VFPVGKTESQTNASQILPTRKWQHQYSLHATGTRNNPTYEEPKEVKFANVLGKEPTQGVPDWRTNNTGKRIYTYHPNEQEEEAQNIR